MPRYFFDVHDGANVIDDVGCECADLAAAQKIAVDAAIDLLGMSRSDIWAGEPWTLKIRDEASNIVGALSFAATT